MQLFAGDVKTVKSGVWSDSTVWSTGTLPKNGDNVNLLHDVTYDQDSLVLSNLTVGTDTSTTATGWTPGWKSTKSKNTILVLTGNLLVYPNCMFKIQTSSSGAALAHTIYIQGNITNNGNAFDMRNGSSTTLGVGNIIFYGSVNSYITMGAYSTTNNEFSAVTVNKTNGAKIVLNTDMVIAQGSSAVSLLYNPVLTFQNGVIETGTHILYHLSTTAIHIDTTSTNLSSYVVGSLARGMSSSAGGAKYFRVGDASGYRPVWVKTSTSGVATGHALCVSVIDGNANTGSSTFPDGLIDKVSQVRYFKITYVKQEALAGTPDTMGVDCFRLSFDNTDGIGVGNTDLRVAYSTDERASWNELHDNSPNVTNPLSTPTYYTSDTLTDPGIILHKNTNSVCVALARLTGTTTNPLDGSPTAVSNELRTVKSFALGQNYPNPFNPSTTINYSVPQSALVTLKVYNVLGKEVAELAHEFKSAGTYQATFKGSDLPSGIYFYTLHAGKFSETRKMILMK
jgi:hypothetical protein